MEYDPRDDNPESLALFNQCDARSLRSHGDPLAANKEFRGLITTGAKDLAENPMTNKFVWTFRTSGS